VLQKQAQVRSPQDNRRNMVNKLDKGSNFTKQNSQQSNKTQMAKSSPRATLSKTRSKVSTTLTISLMLMRLMFLICLIMILMHPMFL
jgi:hypothetical protein